MSCGTGHESVPLLNWVRVLSRRRTRTAGLKRRSTGCWRSSWKRTWTCRAAAAVARGGLRGRRRPKRTRCASWIWCYRRSEGDRSTCGASSRRAKSTFDSRNVRRRRRHRLMVNVVSADSDLVNNYARTRTHTRTSTSVLCRNYRSMKCSIFCLTF